MSAITALIAEDEPLQARGLRAALARAWPELQVVAMVGDGESAVTQALALLPDVLFLDVRMPARSGIDVAAMLAEEWPADRPFAKLVFVTAYDQYAVKAFEHQAVDYLLKPVQPERLEQTVQRLRASLAAVSPGQAPVAGGFDAELAEQLIALQSLLARHSAGPAGAAHAAAAVPAAASASGTHASDGGTMASAGAGRLKLIQASGSAGQANVIRVVPIDEVLCFQAADKYVRVLTANAEYLIRTPLRELIDQLDPEEFWQIHRNTLVRVTAIERIQREENGKARVTLRSLREQMPVSRLYLHRFKAM